MGGTSERGGPASVRRGLWEESLPLRALTANARG